MNSIAMIVIASLIQSEPESRELSVSKTASLVCQGPVTDINLSKSGAYIAYTANNQLKVIEINTLKSLMDGKIVEAGILGGFTSDDSHLVFAQEESVYLINIKNRSISSAYKHDNSIKHLATSGLGEVICTTSTDGDLIVYDTKGMKIIKKAKPFGKDQHIQSLTVMATKNTVLSIIKQVSTDPLKSNQTVYNYSIWCYDYKSDKSQEITNSVAPACVLPAVSSDGSKIAFSISNTSGHNIIAILSLPDLRSLAVVESGIDVIACRYFGGDKFICATGSKRGLVTSPLGLAPGSMSIIDTSSMKSIQTVSPSLGEMQLLSVSADGRSIAVASQSSKTIVVYNASKLIDSSIPLKPK
jgi:WD40 repeat protein